MLYFFCADLLTDSLPPEHADTVAKALEVLNFYLECGSFVLDRQTGLLAYKLVTPVFAYWGERADFGGCEYECGPCAPDF